jgi:hypothetical protein
MATINSSAIFPSIKFISTDALGDVQEVVGSPAVSSFATIDGLTFTAVDAGVDGDNITIELIEGQASNGVVGVEFSVSGEAITIATENGAITYSQGDVENAFASAPTGVSDLVGLSVASSGATLIGTFSATNLANGQEESAGDLDASSDYILIKQSDLYDFETGEENDGRKLLFGIMERASEVYGNLTDPPENLTLVRSAKSLINNGTLVRQTYTLTAQMVMGGLDLAEEA